MAKRIIGGSTTPEPHRIGVAPSQPSNASTGLPPGTPPWITPELVQDTIDTWQPYYADDLTIVDALEILMSVGNLIDILGPNDA